MWEKLIKINNVRGGRFDDKHDDKCDGKCSNKITKKVSAKTRERAIKKADAMGKNASEKDVGKVARNLGKMNFGPIKKIWDKVLSLWRAFNSPDVPLKPKIAIIGALIYLVSPFDVVPDFLLPAGLLDDAAVIAFIYAQCKDIILRVIPKLGEQVVESIHKAGDAAEEEIKRLTEDAISETVGKQFRLYNEQLFFNSLLKLALFTLAATLFHFAPPGRTIDTYIARALLLVVAAWLLYSVFAALVRAIKLIIKFVPNMRRINARENQNALADVHYKKLRWQERAAEAAYTTFADESIPAEQTTRKKLYTFLFRKWNEGKLPAWIPRKAALCTHVWNALKFRVAVFVALIAAYLAVCNLLLKNMP